LVYRNLFFQPIMVVGIDGSPENAWVLKLSHLLVKQIKMCHLGVYNSICT
jgi:hypothetical protein